MLNPDVTSGHKHYPSSYSSTKTDSAPGRPENPETYVLSLRTLITPKPDLNHIALPEHCAFNRVPYFEFLVQVLFRMVNPTSSILLQRLNPKTLTSQSLEP